MLACMHACMHAAQARMYIVIDTDLARELKKRDEAVWAVGLDVSQWRIHVWYLSQNI